jgi:hypothetical protein
MKNILLLVLLLPLLVTAQKQPQWKVQLNGKPIEWQIISDTATINIKNKHKASLNFSYAMPEKVLNSNQSIIVLNKEREELARYSLIDNKASIKLKNIPLTYGNTAFYVYSITLSKNKSASKRDRVGTVFIGKISFITNE